MEERKYKDKPITEILDFVQKDIPFSESEELDKQQDYKDELEKRYPFDRILRKINRMEEKISEQEKIITFLMNHSHDSYNGEVTIPIKKTREGWRFD